MKPLPFPESLPDFMRLFPDDAACATYRAEEADLAFRPELAAAYDSEMSGLKEDLMQAEASYSVAENKLRAEAEHEKYIAQIAVSNKAATWALVSAVVAVVALIISVVTLCR